MTLYDTFLKRVMPLNPFVAGRFLRLYDTLPIFCNFLVENTKTLCNFVLSRQSNGFWDDEE